MNGRSDAEGPESLDSLRPAMKEPSFEVGTKPLDDLDMPPKAPGALTLPCPAASSRLAQVMLTLRTHRKALEELHVAHVSVFGSVARGDDGPESDVDLFIEVPLAGFSLLDLSRIGVFLEDALGSRVDLITTRAALREPRLSQALRDAVPVY